MTHFLAPVIPRALALLADIAEPTETEIMQALDVAIAEVTRDLSRQAGELARSTAEAFDDGKG